MTAGGTARCQAVSIQHRTGGDGENRGRNGISLHLNCAAPSHFSVRVARHWKVRLGLGPKPLFPLWSPVQPNGYSEDVAGLSKRVCYTPAFKPPMNSKDMAEGIRAQL